MTSTNPYIHFSGCMTRFAPDIVVFTQRKIMKQFLFLYCQ